MACQNYPRGGFRVINSFGPRAARRCVCMEQVQKYLDTLLQTSRYGGKTVARDDRTVIVFDTPQWGDREARALRARFPECDVAVQAFDGSMSGFIVIVTRHSEPWGVLSESAFVLAVLGLLWTAWWTYVYLQGGPAAGVAQPGVNI